jgi:hypothetical protein
VRLTIKNKRLLLPGSINSPLNAFLFRWLHLARDPPLPWFNEPVS